MCIRKKTIRQKIYIHRIKRLVYSVMQSDGNSFCGYIVLDSYNKASRDEDNIINDDFHFL